MALNTVPFERIGIIISPEEFERMVMEAVDRVLPTGCVVPPARDLTAAEAAVLEEGGAWLRPRATGADSPLARTAAEYAALLASSLPVAEAAQRLAVDGSRVRQRLAAHTLYGMRHRSGWRLPRFQFGEHGLVAGFERVAPRLAGVDPVSAARWFTQPHPDLAVAAERGAGRGGRTKRTEEPVSLWMWLELGRDPEVVAALADELQGVA